ncbi:MAG TPA: aspartyl/asparaginyl beta-hydroxylase domain-containing protein [Gemmataceae bacterium]|nr:aspartyl/asparaginyl beta-hydroxylase domain-containing protein [Gemmataceae bacterium]
MLPDRLKLDLHFDPTLLQADLQRLETGPWTRHYVPQNFDGDWSIIGLRGPANATHPIKMIYADPVCTEFADYPAFDVCSYIRQVVSTFQCSLRAVRLMKLSPGSRIKEHTDLDLDIDSGMVRLHIPVVTNSDVDFRLNGSRVVLAEGECWYLRLSDPHSVANNGTSDRVHLVIDADVNDWLRDKLEHAGTTMNA